MDLWDFLGCSFLLFFLEFLRGCLFSSGLWFWCVIVFLLFFPLSVRFGGSGVLSHGDVFGFFSFYLFRTFWTLNIDTTVVHMGTYIAERWHRAHGFVCDGEFGPLF